MLSKVRDEITYPLPNFNATPLKFMDGFIFQLFANNINTIRF